MQPVGDIRRVALCIGLLTDPNHGVTDDTVAERGVTTMSNTHQEIERKYEAPAEVEVNIDLGALKNLFPDDQPQDQHLDATYFDTAGRDLARHRVVLRRRRGGHDEGWHVKFVLGEARHEVHADLLKSSDAMPASMKNLLAGITLGEELQPVAHLATHRIRTIIRDEDGTEVAELCDDTVHSTDHATGTERTWREWEVEILDESLGEKAQNKIFTKLEKVLHRAGAHPSTSFAKIGRALDQDRDFDEAAGIQRPEAPEAKKDSPKLTGAQKVISAALHEYLDDIPALDLGVHAGVDDSIHQLRIRIRGLRSVLRGLRGVIDPEIEKRLNEELKASGAVLGEARDLEVVREVLTEGHGWERLTQVAQGHVSDLLAEDEQAAVRASITRLRTTEHLELLGELRAFARQPVMAEKASEWSGKKVAKAILSTLTKRLSHREGKAEGLEDPLVEEALEGIHDVRKAAKSLRYAIDTLDAESAVPKKRRHDVKADRREAKTLQSHLGRTMDLEAAGRWLDHAARVFQRRDLDRYGIGLLSGELSVSLEASLADSLNLVHEMDEN